MVGLDKSKESLIKMIPDLNTSIILVGQKGVGKFTLICEVLSEIVNNKDNIHILQCEQNKTSISIEQVRELFEVINIMPYNDSRHYIVIDDADKLGDVAYNSILKRLEEPKKIRIIYISDIRYWCFIRYYKIKMFTDTN